MAENTVANKPKTAAKPKTVKIKLPLTRTEKEDVYVGINGVGYQIKRGETVEVPYFVAKEIERSEQMLALAMEYEAQASANADSRELQ